MNSVDPEQGLLDFKSDDTICVFVLDKEEPGISEPF
jgi:hypothetical protein